MAIRFSVYANLIYTVVTGNVERADTGLRIGFHLTFWRQRIDKQKRGVMRDTTFITEGRGRTVLWVESYQTVPACNDVATFWCPGPGIIMAARDRNYKFQKSYFAHKTAICRNPSTNSFIAERKQLHWLILCRPTLQHFTFLLQYKEKQFCL
jgi:hypothetical protein